jgi:hypothetical protein
MLATARKPSTAGKPVHQDRQQQHVLKEQQKHRQHHWLRTPGRSLIAERPTTGNHQELKERQQQQGCLPQSGCKQQQCQKQQQ